MPPALVSKTTSAKESPRPEEIFDILEKFSTETLLDKDKDLITRAYHFAERAHKGQFRKSGEPYFFHVFEVGKNLAHLGMDTTTIAAGILHDVIEDTSVTDDDIRKEFGDDILFLVNGVTKLGTLKYRGEERHVESLRKFFVASAKDIRVIIIKFADRLHNLQTLGALADRPDKQKRIALESIEIYAPLAYRLGMGKLTKEIEDLAFQYAYPKEYAEITELLKHRKKSDERYVEKVYKTLKKEMAQHGVRDIKTEYRVKHKYSLFRKLQRKDMSIENIYDVTALRVIVPTIEDCYKVLGIIHSMWRPLPGRIKDYIALPKTNGYRSLHTTIFTGDGGIAEIQIRTPDMDSQAEYGIASHFLYKEKQRTADTNNIKWLATLTELQKEEHKPSKFLENLLSDFLGDRIFVFTPKGDVIDLPKGSTVIDFAYAIHSDVGNHMKGAKVNGKFIALKTPLKDNDIVEIEQQQSAAPHSKWIEYAKTTLARKHIAKYLKEHPSGGILDRFFSRS